MYLSKQRLESHRDIVNKYLQDFHLITLYKDNSDQ